MHIALVIFVFWLQLTLRSHFDSAVMRCKSILELICFSVFRKDQYMFTLFCSSFHIFGYPVFFFLCMCTRFTFFLLSILYVVLILWYIFHFFLLSLNSLSIFHLPPSVIFFILSFANSKRLRHDSPFITSQMVSDQFQYFVLLSLFFSN